jgi:hypothetical protein
MDVDHLSSNSESINNCWEDWVAFNSASGTFSSLFENLVPEMMLSSTDRPREGVSAAKALAYAEANGQTIYRIDQSNISSSLPIINVDYAAKSEIQNEVLKGNFVTIHEAPINIGGWVGSGYTIIDPDTGTGAYKISGGFNGGFISDEMAEWLTYGSFVAALIAALFSIVWLAVLAIAVTVALAIDGYLDLMEQIEGTPCEGGVQALYIGLVTIGIILGLFFGIAGVAIGAWIGFFAAGAISGAVSNYPSCRQ